MNASHLILGNVEFLLVCLNAFACELSFLSIFCLLTTDYDLVKK